MHTNTIDLIENPPSTPNHPILENTVLISIRELNLVCAIDLTQKKVYWGESDLWHRQHQPSLLANGNLLIFDNEGIKGKSRIIEFDPSTRQIHWQYQGDKNRRFFSSIIGSCQRLSGGNTLITESEPGRAFEVTVDKKIVWEYVNPHRGGRKDKLIAILLEVIRLDKDFPTDWLP